MRSGWRSFGWATLAGVIVTGVVVLAHQRGYLDTLEGYLIDVRMRHAHWRSPPISDAILHIDIDDDSLREIGRWPWDRELLAMGIEVLREAGPRTIVLDILLHDTQKVRFRPDWKGGLEAVHDDSRLGEALERAGNVLVGVSIGRMEDEDAPEDAAGKGRGRATPEDEEGEVEIQWPIPPLRESIEGVGFVIVGREEQAIRRMGMSTDVGETRLYQLGVAGVAHFLGEWPDGMAATQRRLRVGERGVALREGRALVPWRPRDAGEEVDWVTGDQKMWQRIHRRVPMRSFVEIGKARRELRVGVGILTGGSPLDHDATEEDLRRAEETAQWRMEEYEGRGVEEVLRELTEAQKTEPRADRLEEINYLEAVASLPALRRHFEALERRMEDWRAIVGDKLVFVGWTGTAVAADFYPTAMHVRTPGVSVHSAIANGLLTGHWIDQAPSWLDLLMTFGAGLSATLVASVLSPARGWAAALVLTGAYVGFNVVVVFDGWDTSLALAGPLVAAVGSWATCTTIRAIQERREKAAIRRQFRARVSAQLVDYLSEHPDLVNMEGEERELTIAFTDFAGFTSISEKLEGRATVAMLNRYLRAMTEVMLDRSGYVNKFLGDGIMAFWGAPALDPRHANEAVFAVLDCYDALDMLNRAPEYEELPKLGMRVGISTGKVIVGDCGAPPRLNDYTVIGDAVNLAARLESANKMLGTRGLVTQRTIDQIEPEERERVLWRPMGKLRGVGQTRLTEVSELVGRSGDTEITEETRAWVERTREAVELFERGDLEKSREIWQELVLFERGSAGALLYVERCAELLESGREDYFLPLRSK